MEDISFFEEVKTIDVVQLIEKYQARLDRVNQLLDQNTDVIPLTPA